jgi:hypothetical protein
MKHIRNSIKGVFFLEHQGVPVATVTDFGETIKDGSLCVDRNSHNLYILKNGVWTLFSVGISSGDFIPRAGTDVGFPVTGDIEMQDGVSIERGSSQITFTNDALIFHFSDNDGNPSDDCGVTMNRNIIFQMDSAIMSVDTNSSGNFVYKAIDNFQLYQSDDNTIFTKAENLYLTDVNRTTILNNVSFSNINNLDNSMIEGNFRNLTIDGTAGSLHGTYEDSENIFLKGGNVVSKPLPFAFTTDIIGSYDVYLEGLFANNSVESGLNIYGKGVFTNRSQNDTDLHTYGKFGATTLNNFDFYSLGDVDFGARFELSNFIYVLGKVTNVDFLSSYDIVSIGYVSGLNLRNTSYTQLVNCVNPNEITIIQSNDLSIYNNTNQIAESQIVDTEYLVAYSNQRIESTSSVNNILFGTRDITLENSYNNFIIGDGRKDDGVYRNGLNSSGGIGSNNAIFGLESTASVYYSIGDYNFVTLLLTIH